jgi:hypothetical protein
MDELITTIRAAVAEGATAEHKQRGAAACRAILTALNAAPGQALAAPAVAAAPTNPFAILRQLDVDQVLDLVIAKLRSIAPTGQPEAGRTSGLNVPLVSVPRK